VQYGKKAYGTAHLPLYLGPRSLHGAFSTLRPVGLLYSHPQQVPAFISRGATHHTDAPDLYQ